MVTIIYLARGKMHYKTGEDCLGVRLHIPTANEHGLNLLIPTPLNLPVNPNPNPTPPNLYGSGLHYTATKLLIVVETDIKPRTWLDWFMVGWM